MSEDYGLPSNEKTASLGGNMKFKHLACTGHPRSGTHYITGLISTNFLEDIDYLEIYRNHEFPHMATDPATAYFHIWRDFEGIGKSVYLLKERFGLEVDRYEDFLQRRYCDMWHENDPNAVLTNVRTLNGSAQFGGVSDFFKEADMTPREFWSYYNGLWRDSARENQNIISVKYDDMVTRFEGTMRWIAKRLGSQVTEFKNIKGKIGWWK